MPYGRRRQLVDRGVELALAQRLQDLLSGVETRSISDAVGVTTGSFFHHFRNRGHFADAVAQRFVECWQERVDRLLDTSEGVVAEPGPESFRHACAVEWTRLRDMTGTVGLQHLLWIARAQPIGDETSVTAGEVLHDAYHRLVAALQPLYDRGMVAMGRETLPPFDHIDLAVVLTAMAEGLQMVDAVAPDLLRDDLYADVMTALFIGLTRPRSERAETTPPLELAALESRLRPNPTARRGAPGEPVETWRQIADAAAHLFVDRSPIEVRVADVAEAAGVSTSTVYHQFGTVWSVAAAGFAQHISELEAIAQQPLTASEGPVVRIEQVLARYVELVKANRGAAEALAAESVTVLGPGSDRTRRRDIRTSVPLTETLLDLVRELRVRGLLRRRIDSDRLARSLFQLTTMQALGFPEDPVERIVDETITLVLEGALVGSAAD